MEQAIFQHRHSAWLNGDKGQLHHQKAETWAAIIEWHSLNNEDIISMPDKWEYPWYAAWDLAFHCVPLSLIDPEFAKSQLLLFLREWYMHPNGSCLHTNGHLVMLIHRCMHGLHAGL